ncbi:MAG TPA: glycosyl hydrolase, partial [Anaerolineae bacterium]
SRAFFKKAAHPATGLMPDYAEFDGQPISDPDHGSFRFDAFRAASNVAVDYAWFAADPWEVEQSNRLLEFFAKQGINSYGNQFTLDGKPLSGDHSTGLVAMNAVAALAATTESRKDFVAALWNVAIPSGQWRYYDGLLYLLGLLHVSGNFKIYEPGAASASPRPTSTPDPIMKAKFVPPDGKTLLIVGQDLDTVDEYARTVGIDPGGVTTNTSLQNLEGITERADHGSGVVYMAGLVQNHPNSALAMGLDVVNSLEAINTGALDSNLDRLLDQLAELKRPVFVRFGYEFDSSRNHYDPEQYKQAWIKFYNRMKEKQIDNIALVWQSASACSGTDGSQPIDAWYPGDAYVDWVGLSFFTQADCKFQPIEAVLTFARKHHKPVMIAESAPQRYATSELSYSTDGATFTNLTSTQFWKEWYVPYFDYIRNNTDVIKAVAYINTFWDSQKMWGPPYTNGYRGDSRVQANPGILARWKSEIGESNWLQAAPDLFAQLGYHSPKP